MFSCTPMDSQYWEYPWSSVDATVEYNKLAENEQV